MDIKLTKKDFNPVSVGSDGYATVMGVTLKLKQETKTHYVFTNVSTADIEILQMKTNAPILVKSRYVRSFVPATNPEWRG